LAELALFLAALVELVAEGQDLSLIFGDALAELADEFVFGTEFGGVEQVVAPEV
jgi:hypothetical protein